MKNTGTMKSVAKARREREKFATRKRILDEALLLAQNEGWQSVSIRKIASAIEYTPPVVYEYFESKEQIFTALSSDGFVLFQQQCENAVAVAVHAREAIMNISLAMMRFANEYPQYYQVMFNLEGVVCKNEKSLNAAFIKNILREISPDSDADNLFLNWWAIVHGFVNICMTDLIHLPKKQKEDFLTTFIQRFIRSI